MGPSDSLDTNRTADWHYVAEGGANIVFGYHGSNPQYIGKALRIPKNYQESDLANTWRDDVLTRLLEERDLPGHSTVELAADWVRGLVGSSSDSRPQMRRDADQKDHWSGSEVVKGTLMDDLRSGPKEAGQKVLAIEIKVSRNPPRDLQGWYEDLEFILYSLNGDSSPLQKTSARLKRPLSNPNIRDIDYISTSEENRASMSP